MTGTVKVDFQTACYVISLNFEKNDGIFAVSLSNCTGKGGSRTSRQKRVTLALSDQNGAAQIEKYRVAKRE